MLAYLLPQWHFDAALISSTGGTKAALRSVSDGRGGGTGTRLTRTTSRIVYRLSRSSMSFGEDRKPSSPLRRDEGKDDRAGMVM